MTSDRSKAYGRVMHLVSAQTLLSDGEQATIREAADSLLFCEEIEDSPDVMESLVAAIELGQGLVASGRWASWRLELLVEELSECGPGPVPQPAAV
jgi:hypothetical protein